MNKIVSINSKKFLGSYLSAQHQNGNFEDKFFAAGMVFTASLMPLISIVAGGAIPVFVFSSCIFAGTIIGAAVFTNRNSGEVLGLNQQAPADKGKNRKMAA